MADFLTYLKKMKKQIYNFKSLRHGTELSKIPDIIAPVCRFD